jgi:hypothetical protein
MENWNRGGKSFVQSEVIEWEEALEREEERRKSL